MVIKSGDIKTGQKEFETHSELKRLEALNKQYTTGLSTRSGTYGSTEQA
jgi:hypothetical protein